MNKWRGSVATNARNSLAALVATGTAICGRCGKPIDPREPWDTGHIIDRSAGGTNARTNLRPEHASCNRRAGQTLTVAHKRKRTRNDKRIRQW